MDKKKEQKKSYTRITDTHRSLIFFLKKLFSIIFFLIAIWQKYKYIYTNTHTYIHSSFLHVAWQLLWNDVRKYNTHTHDNWLWQTAAWHEKKAITFARISSIWKRLYECGVRSDFGCDLFAKSLFHIIFVVVISSHSLISFICFFFIFEYFCWHRQRTIACTYDDTFILKFDSAHHTSRIKKSWSTILFFIGVVYIHVCTPYIMWEIECACVRFISSIQYIDRWHQWQWVAVFFGFVLYITA